MWKLRETISLSLMRDGYVYKHDISLPLEYFYKITEVIREKVKSQATRVVAFGHMGDGNLHLNVTSSEYKEEIYNR